MAWDESKHPRDSIGQFSETNETTIISPYAPGSINYDTSKITKYEWRSWYDRIGDIKRGLWCPKNKDGYLILINNKIFITKGTYSAPVLKNIVEFADDEVAIAFLERFVKW